jgi:hypothetical protein
LYHFGIIALTLATPGYIVGLRPAWAATPCSWQETVWEGKIAQGGVLSKTNDTDLTTNRDVRVLINRFNTDVYDAAMLTDEQIRSNIDGMFLSQFTFEVCNTNTSGGHDQIYFIQNDLDGFTEKVISNYHWLWDHGIAPTHTLDNTALRVVGNDIVEKSIIHLLLAPTLDSGQQFDYKGRIYSTISKDQNGKWRFKERYLIIDPGYELASYGR